MDNFASTLSDSGNYSPKTATKEAAVLLSNPETQIHYMFFNSATSDNTPLHLHKYYIA